jgi:hypothetical protein
MLDTDCLVPRNDGCRLHNKIAATLMIQIASFLAMTASNLKKCINTNDQLKQITRIQVLASLVFHGDWRTHIADYLFCLVY